MGDHMVLVKDLVKVSFQHFSIVREMNNCNYLQNIYMHTFITKIIIIIK